MKYGIDLCENVTNYYKVEIEADSIEEAKEIAFQMLINENLKPFDIDTEMQEVTGCWEIKE